MLKRKYIIYSLSLSLIISCSLIYWLASYLWLLKMPAVYNDPLNKYWAHANNSIEKAQDNSKKFKGLELDLNYDENTGSILVCHDKKESCRLMLKEYFTSISDTSIFFGSTSKI